MIAHSEILCIGPWYNTPPYSLTFNLSITIFLLCFLSLSLVLHYNPSLFICILLALSLLIHFLSNSLSLSISIYLSLSNSITLSPPTLSLSISLTFSPYLPISLFIPLSFSVRHNIPNIIYQNINRFHSFALSHSLSPSLCLPLNPLVPSLSIPVHTNRIKSR